MNPYKELENLRHFIDGKEQEGTAKHLKLEEKDLEVFLSGKRYTRGTEFLKTLVSHFLDMRKAFPRPHYDGKMDFICNLDTGEKAIVEMQIMPENNWEMRMLAYLAASYSNQMRQGMQWEEIRTVIGISILGGGLNDERHWKQTPEQYTRHYKLQEQINGEVPPRFIEGIELIPYSLANVPLDKVPPERKEWLIFFRSAHNMTEAEVKQTIKTPAVLAAFERAKLVNLPEDVMESYKEEELKLKNLSGHIAEGKEEGFAEGIEKGEVKKAREMALCLLENGIPISLIVTASGLSEEEIRSLCIERPT